MKTIRFGKTNEEIINEEKQQRKTDDVCHGNPFKRKANSKYWSFRYYIFDEEKGKKMQHLSSGYLTYEEALAEKEKTEEEIANGTFYANSLTVEQYLLKWLEGKDNLSKNSYDGYMVNIKKHIIPYFRNVKISDIKKRDVLRLYDKLAKGIDENGEETKRKLNGTSIKYVHSNFSEAFRDAFCDGYIKTNPFLDFKKEEVPKKSVYCGNPLNSEHTQLILESSKNWNDGRLYLMTLIFLNTGMRCSECLGLKFSDFAENGDLKIQRQIKKLKNGKLGEGPLKSKVEGDYRLIHVSPTTMEQIKEEKSKREKCNVEEYKNSEYVFCSEDGKFLYRNWIYKNYKKLFEETKCANINTTIHDFRRTFATNLYNKGISVNEIKEAMGHSSVRTTEKYIYANKEASSKIANINEELY